MRKENTFELGCQQKNITHGTNDVFVWRAVRRDVSMMRKISLLFLVAK
jgi:hypothetical protein